MSHFTLERAHIKPDQIKDLDPFFKTIQPLLDTPLNTLYAKKDPTLLQKATNGLFKDLEESFLNTMKKQWGEEKAKEQWEILSQKGLRSCFETKIKKELQFILEKARSLFENLTNRMSSCLPTVMSELLSNYGIGKKTRPIWIEFYKQEDEKFRLSIYFNDPNQEISACSKKGYYMPLIYSNVEENKLNDNFFQSLLYYQAWPQWGKAHSFSLTDFKEGCLSLLGKSSDPLSKKEHILSKEISPYQGEWGMFQMFFNKNRLKDSSFNYKRDVLFTIKKQALIDITSHLMHSPKLLKNSALVKLVRKEAKHLASDARKLFESGKLITKKELQEVYATGSEILELTNSVKKKKRNLPSTIVIPKEIKVLIASLLLESYSAEYIEMLKEAFIDVLGTEIKEPIEEILKEILPPLDQLKSIQKDNADDKTKILSFSWKNFTSFNEWKGLHKELTHLKKHFSPMQWRRVGQHAWNIASNPISHIILALLLQHAQHLLPIKLSSDCFSSYFKSSLKTLTLSTALKYGPLAIQKSGLKELGEPLIALSDLYQEIRNYFAQRIQIFIAKTAIHLVLREKKEILVNSFYAVQHRATRTGTLSYKCEEPFSKNLLSIKKGKYFLEKKTSKTPILYKQWDKGTKYVPVPTFKTVQELTKHLQQLLAKQEKNKTNELGKVITSALKKVTPSAFTASDLIEFNKMFRQLPIPKKGARDSFWDTVKDPMEVLHLFDSIVKNKISTLQDSLSLSERTELNITLYGMYAIADHLARKIPETQLEGYQSNGWNLVLWLSHPGVHITQPSTYKQLQELGKYFNFDVEKRYTIEEINRERAKCLFNYNGAGCYFPLFDSEKQLHWIGTYFSKESKYYNQFQTKEKEAISFLFNNPPKGFQILRSLNNFATTHTTHTTQLDLAIVQRENRKQVIIKEFKKSNESNNHLKPQNTKSTKNILNEDDSFEGYPLKFDDQSTINQTINFLSSISTEMIPSQLPEISISGTIDKIHHKLLTPIIEFFLPDNPIFDLPSEVITTKKSNKNRKIASKNHLRNNFDCYNDFTSKFITKGKKRTQYEISVNPQHKLSSKEAPLSVE